MDLDKKLINLNKLSNADKWRKKAADADQSVPAFLPKKASSKELPKITRIQAQKRAGRYNIFVDHSFAFGIDEAVLVRYQLQKGMSLPAELQEEIIEQEGIQKAYQKALDHLSYGKRTAHQIREHLAEHELADHAEEVLVRLEDLKLIDDLDYAESYIRTGARVPQKGPERLMRELLQRGVSELTIEEALVEYPFDWQLDNARELAQKNFEKHTRHSEREAQQKVQAFLKNKGYSFDIIREVFDEISFTKDSEEEYRALKELGERAIKRYSRRSEGYELTQKTKAYLYRKGFSQEMIDRFLNELDD